MDVIYVDDRVGTTAAILVGVSPALDGEANRIASIARGVASAHARTGDLASSIKVKNIPARVGPVTDRYVYTDDPAAIQIIWGTSRGGWGGSSTSAVDLFGGAIDASRKG